MTASRQVQQARRSREVDRTAWAHQREEIYRYTTIGSGQGWTPAIVFKTAFEGEPLFTFGIVTPQETPASLFVNAGVQGWQTHATGEARTLFYIAAWVWVIVEGTEEQIDWTFRFWGMALRNRQSIPRGDSSIPPPIPQAPPVVPPPEPEKFRTLQRFQRVDALKIGPVKLTHPTDLILQVREILVHTSDLQLVLFAEVSHSTDLEVVTGPAAVIHLTDLILRVTNEAIHSTDMVAQTRVTTTHTGDALVSEEGPWSDPIPVVTPLPHTTDLVTYAVEALTHTTDVELAITAVETLTHTTDVDLITTGVETLTHTTDIALVGTSTMGHSTDAVLDANVEARVSQMTLEALIQNPDPDAQVSQMVLEALTQEDDPGASASSIFIEILQQVDGG